MPRQLQGGWLANYLHYTEEQESPENFHFWTGLTILAATLKRHIWIDRKFYKLYPNLYTVVVAVSAECKKSTATDIGESLLSKVFSKEPTRQVRIFRDRISASGLIDCIQDVQPELIGTRITKDSSILMYAPELATFLTKESFTQEIVPILTSLYTSGKFNSKTIKHGQIRITDCSPSILGATTPESLAKCIPLEIFGLGFPGRFIFVVEKDVGKKVAWMNKDEELEQLLIQDLEHIASLNGEVRVDDNVKLFYKNWYDDYKIPPDSPSALIPYYQRKPELVLKLAMILAVNYRDDLILHPTHISTAINLLFGIEENMPIAFQYTGTDTSALAQEIVDFLASRKTPISNPELLRRFRNKLKSVDDLKNTLTILQGMGMIDSRNRGSLVGYALREKILQARKSISPEEIMEKLNGNNLHLSATNPKITEIETTEVQKSDWEREEEKEKEKEVQNGKEEFKRLGKLPS